MNVELGNQISAKTAWFKKRTPLERGLIIFSVVVAIIALALIVTVLVISLKNDNEICTSPACVDAASRLLNYVNLSADPCDDFYEFSCGGFMKKMTIPDDQTSVETFSVVRDIVKEQTKLLIEEPLDKNPPRSYRMLKEFYELCMNTSAIEKDGLKTAQILLKRLGGWPLLEGNNWREEHFDWKQSIYTLRRMGFSPDHLISFGISVDYKNSSRALINIDEATLGITRELLLQGLSNKIVKAFYQYAVDISVLFGASRKRALMELQDVLDFQIKIANITTPVEELRDVTTRYHLMTIRELQENYPDLPWLEYITKLFGIPDIKITPNETVLVGSPEYLTKLFQLLRYVPKRVLANSFITGAAISMVPYLNEEMKDRMFEMKKIVMGSVEKEPRWKECVLGVQSNFRLVLGAMYVRKYFDVEAKTVAEEIVEDIRNQFVKTLEELDWMDDVTRKFAMEKVAAMSVHIGYPDELLNNTLVEEFYEDLYLPTSSYLQTILSLGLFGQEYSYRKLRKPIIKNDWIMHSIPYVVNAMYNPSENSIQFPAAILQGLFFDQNRPRYLNYGSIGSTIGHEISHGFDDQGRLFDKNGNLNDWWEEHTKKSFKEKAQCIIDQYGNYTVPDIGQKLNGINTQGENIADNGGVIQSYYAYQSWVDRNGPESKLPGFTDYTPNQMFWIAAASVECSKERKEAQLMRILNGVHSPGIFRVNGPYSNAESFSKDYNCPLGSKMNPEKKCRVW